MRLNFGPQEVVGIVKRRLFWALIPFLLLSLIALRVIAMLPPLYQSEAKLIVVDQQIRNEYVRSPVSSDALQRVEELSARVRARDNLTDLVRDMGLYDDENMRSFSQRAERLRRNLSIGIQRIQSAGGFNAPSAIIVDFSVRHEDPAMAQRIANRILTDFQNRNVEMRTDIAAGQADFLQDEERVVARRLEQITARITEIKQENQKTLPENRGLYEDALSRAVAEKARTDLMIEETEQEIRLLELQRPLLVQSGGAGQDPALAELSAKRRELSALQRQFTDTYPDVVALKQEVLALERDLDPGAFKKRAREEVASINSALAGLDRDSAAAQDLIARRNALQADLRTIPPGVEGASLSEIQYEARMSNLETRLASLRRQRDELGEQIADYESRIAATPVVEGQLYRLEQEREQLEGELSMLRSNRSSAERSKSLEEQAKAERLSVLEQPSAPEEPVSPDRPKLAILGFAVAGAIAGALALFPEVFDPRVTTRSHVQEMLPNLRVIEIPRFEVAKRPAWQTFGVYGLAGLSVALTGLVGLSAYTTLL